MFNIKDFAKNSKEKIENATTKKEINDAKLELVSYLLAQLYLYLDEYNEVIEKFGEDTVMDKVAQIIAQENGD